MSKPEDPHPARDKAPNLIEWFGYSTSTDFSRPATLGGIFRVVFSWFLILFYLAAILAAAYVIKHTIDPTQNPISDGPNLGAGALIAAILAAPFVIWRTHIAQRTVDLQHQGQITDRISKAVEQLGAEKTVKLPGKDGTATEQTKPNIVVRIGGLYALGRIAEDSMTSDKGRDHIPIMEILCAYIRENAPASKAADCPADLTNDNLERWAVALSPPRTDLQTALEIIGLRTSVQIKLERATPARGSDFGYLLDLRATCLQRADLSEMAFNRALFTYTRMQGANLRSAQMQGADLRWAQMEGAYLRRAQMQGAVLTEAKMQAAVLWSANLRSANFTDATGLTQDALTRAYGDSGTILPPGLSRPAHWDTATLKGPWANDPEYRAWLATTDPAGQPLPP